MLIQQKALAKLYENRQKFILIGLTGRTGSGCTSAGKILNSEFNDIKLPKPCSCKTNEDRKYKIIYKFAKQNWKKFHLIQIRDIITSFIIENTYDTFIEYLKQIYDKHNESKIFYAIKEKLDSQIKSEYENIYKLRKELTEKRETLNKGSETYQNDVQNLRKELYCFYFEKLPQFSKKLKKILNSVKGNAYISVYQYLGNNIRSSGKAFDRHFDANHIYRISQRVNRIIKILRRFAKKDNMPMHLTPNSI